MILVRDVFQLKFGKAKEAIAAWKEGRVLNEKLGYPPGRLLTDIAGTNYYTLVLESTFPSLSEYEKAGKSTMGNAEWHAWYQKVVAFTESGHREIFNVVE